MLADVSASQQLEQEAQEAWKELSRVAREQERLQAVRAAAQAELDASRRRAQILEQVRAGGKSLLSPHNLTWRLHLIFFLFSIKRS